MTVKTTIDRVEDFGANQLQQSTPGRISNSPIAGRNAIRFFLKDGLTPDQFNGTHRCEAIIPGKPGQPYEVKEGSERWIGAGLYIVKGGWASNKTLLQIRSYPETAQPYFGLLKYDSTGKLGCSGAPELFTPTYDKWMQVLIRVKHSAQPLSEADVYIDGALKCKSRGKVTIGTGGYLKLGLYGETRPTDFDATVYFSHIIVATMRAEAEAVTSTPAKAAIKCPVCGTDYVAQI